MPDDRSAARRFALAVAVSVAVVLATPFIGDIRSWLMAQLGRRFVTVANGALLLAAILVVAATVARIRHRRAIRYGLLAAAAAVAWVYGQGAPGASAVTRAVERFHFFEYGLITLLFVRAFTASGRADPATFVLAALAGLIVGTLEEAVQWFIPERIGEIRDIFLNASAIAVGLLVALAVDPPRSFTWRVTPRARTAVAGAAALAVVLVALFIRVVHLGELVADRDVAFHSRYSSAALAGLSLSRAASWAGTPPARPATLSREDQYLTEALWHVQARNTRWDAGDAGAARGEDRILEKYFAPVLDLGHRWPPEQRADADRRSGPFRSQYVSRAERLPIWTWPRPAFWSGVAVILAALAAFGWPRRASRGTPGSHAAAGQ